MSDSGGPLIGVLGGGQLGKMLAEAGAPLGMRFRFLDPSPEACAQRAGELIVGDYTDPAALERFARDLDIVTYEHEHLPAEALELLSRRMRTAPGVRSLLEVQSRVSQRRLLARAGVDQTEHAVIDLDEVEVAAATGGPAALRRAVERVGAPGILKTATGGYDGKGQVRIESADQCDEAWAALSPLTAVYERFVDFERELSIVGVRAVGGAKRFYPIVESVHEHGILVRTIAPAPGDVETVRSLQAKAERSAGAIVDELDHVGAFALELFQVRGRSGPEVIANEFAGRVHNTGHWTIEGAATSQFENHLRAITGMDLAPTDMAVPACSMVNFIGELPAERPSRDGMFYHDYGKRPAPGRKVGHVTVCGASPAEVAERIAGLPAGLGGRRVRV